MASLPRKDFGERVVVLTAIPNLQKDLMLDAPTWTHMIAPFGGGGGGRTDCPKGETTGKETTLVSGLSDDVLQDKPSLKLQSVMRTCPKLTTLIAAHNPVTAKIAGRGRAINGARLPALFPATSLLLLLTEHAPKLSLFSHTIWPQTLRSSGRINPLR